MFRCCTYLSSPPSISHSSPESAEVTSDRQTGRDRQVDSCQHSVRLKLQNLKMNLILKECGLPGSGLSQPSVNSPCRPAWLWSGLGLGPEPSCSPPEPRPAFLSAHKALPSAAMPAHSLDSVLLLRQPDITSQHMCPTVMSCIGAE